MEKPSGDDYTPPLTAATVWRDVPEANRLVTVDFFERQVAACPVAADCLRKDFYSHLILSLLEVDLVERGRISCFFSVNPAVAVTRCFIPSSALLIYVCDTSFCCSVRRVVFYFLVCLAAEKSWTRDEFLTLCLLLLVDLFLSFLFLEN